MNDIKTPQQLLDYMKKHMRYGWIGTDGSTHIEKMQDFRLLYRINSIEQIFETGLVTCIESAIVAQTWFNINNIENRLFCHRSYENEDNFDKKVKMHIIILYKDKDKWVHFEYSNRPEQGLHEYDSIERALEEVTGGYKDCGDIRVLTEITNIPEGLSFKEFNNYVNNFESMNKSKTK